MKHFDVAVIGGGSAGLCASVAAARRGAKTVLIERSQKLGGMGTRALVHTFCGLYEPDVSHPPQLCNQGLVTEIEQEMRTRTGQSEPTKMGRVYVLLQDPVEFARLAGKLTEAEDNLTVSYQTSCQGITRDQHFQILTDQGEISATSIVDCSADAVVAEFLGASRMKSKTLQKGAFVFALRGIGPEALTDSFKMRFALDLVRAVQANTLPGELLGAASRPSTRPDELYFTIDLDDPVQGPGLARELITFLKNHSPAFSSVKEPIFPEIVGIRETYRWSGQYEVTADDLVEGRSFDDTVAFAGWPVELRETTRGPRFQYFAKPRASEIPLRSLTSREIPGVFFAGRCLSATHEALASLRVMGTCFATGQAAGLAASLHARGVTPTAGLIVGEIKNL